MLGRSLEILCLVIFAGAVALVPTALSIWISSEISIRAYMEKHDLLFRTDLEDDYGLGFDLLIDTIVVGTVSYVIFLAALLLVFLRLERKADAKASASAHTRDQA